LLDDRLALWTTYIFIENIVFCFYLILIKMKKKKVFSEEGFPFHFGPTHLLLVVSHHITSFGGM
jgi:hypothetical protein